MKKYIGALWLQYDKAFGCEASDIHPNKYWDEDEPEYPAVSVSVYRKENTGRTHDILVTSGMSWRPMNFGEGYSGERWSTELIQYVDHATDEDISWLFWLAILPFIDDFALGYGHTVSYPEPLYDNSLLSNFLFLNSLIHNDSRVLDGFSEFLHPIDLLWVVPITASEYALKKEKGVNVMLDLFQENEHPITLNKLRAGYVKSE